LVTLISRDEVIFRPFPRYHPCWLCRCDAKST